MAARCTVLSTPAPAGKPRRVTLSFTLIRGEPPPSPEILHPDFVLLVANAFSCADQLICSCKVCPLDPKKQKLPP